MSAWFHGEVIDTVEQQLCLAWPFDPYAPLSAETVLREAVWHARAVDSFVEVNKDSHALVAGIYNVSRRLLLELTENEELPEYLSQPIRKDDLEPIKRFRKLMMVGRDSLRATSDFQNEDGHPINRLCHNLGLIADTEGQEPKIIAAATDAFDDMPGSLEYAVAEPVDVHRQLTKRLSMVGLNLNAPGFSTEAYHRNRIGFRRAVHFGIASAIVHPTALKEAFVAEGLAFNTMYGDRHTDMYKQLAKAA